MDFRKNETFKSNNPRGHFIEKFISKHLKKSLVCQGIDIFWKRIPLEVKSSSVIKSSGSYFFHITNNHLSKYHIFVGLKDNLPTYFWVIPSNKKFLDSKNKYGISLPTTKEKGKIVYRKYICSLEEIGKKIS